MPTVVSVLSEGDRIELQVELHKDRTARIALWQVVEWIRAAGEAKARRTPFADESNEMNSKSFSSALFYRLAAVCCVYYVAAQLLQEIVFHLGINDSASGKWKFCSG